MPEDRRCPYCHEFVAASKYTKHIAKHEALLPDGQQTDHATVAPEDRYRGSLENVPRAYRHKKCKGVTTMPEEIVRSYLAEPFYLNKNTSTFCTGCNSYVPLKDVKWVETKENVSDYLGRLQVEAVRAGTAEPPIMPVGCYAFLLGGLTAPLGGFCGWLAAGWLGLVLGVALGMATATGIGVLLNGREVAHWDRIKRGESDEG